MTEIEAKLDIKLSIMHLNWHLPRKEQFEPWLDEVKEAGYDGITSFAHWGLEDYISKPAALGRMLQARDLQLAAVDAEIYTDYERYKPILHFMQELGCKLLVCIDPAGTAKEYEKYGAILNDIGALAQSYGITAHYHNHTNAVGETLTDMEALMQHLDFTKVGLMLDTGHATKDFAELPPEERAFHFLQKYWDRIDYLELKDWNEKSDLNTPLGEGHTDYERIFKLMRQKGYQGWITVEQNGDNGWSLGRSPLETAKISREFIREKLKI